jgi:hypothetical protein
MDLFQAEQAPALFSQVYTGRLLSLLNWPRRPRLDSRFDLLP